MADAFKHRRRSQVMIAFSALLAVQRDLAINDYPICRLPQADI